MIELMDQEVPTKGVFISYYKVQFAQIQKNCGFLGINLSRRFNGQPVLTYQVPLLLLEGLCCSADSSVLIVAHSERHIAGGSQALNPILLLIDRLEPWFRSHYKRH